MKTCFFLDRFNDSNFAYEVIYHFFGWSAVMNLLKDKQNIELLRFFKFQRLLVTELSKITPLTELLITWCPTS